MEHTVLKGVRASAAVAVPRALLLVIAKRRGE